MHRVKPIEVHVLTCYYDVHVSLRLYVVSTAGFSCDVGCHIPKYLMTFTSKVLGFITAWTLIFFVFTSDLLKVHLKHFSRCL